MKISWLAMGVVLVGCAVDRPTAAPPPAPAPLASPAPIEPEKTDAPALGPQTCDAVACRGSADDTLRTAIRNRGQTAYRCYDELRARLAGRSGRVSLLVRIGSSGNVCRTEALEKAIEADDEFYQCLTSRFASSFPPPTGGCLDVALPLDFPRVDAGAPPPD